MYFYPEPRSFIVLGEEHGMKMAMLRWPWWSLNYFCVLGRYLLEREGKQFDKSTLAFTCCFVIPSWQQTIARVRILSDWCPLLSISFFFFPLALQITIFSRTRTALTLSNKMFCASFATLSPVIYLTPLSGTIQLFFMEVWVVLPGRYLA